VCLIIIGLAPTFPKFVVHSRAHFTNFGKVMGASKLMNQVPLSI
jgi:hypothetical protein